MLGKRCGAERDSGPWWLSAVTRSLAASMNTACCLTHMGRRGRPAALLLPLPLPLLLLLAACACLPAAAGARVRVSAALNAGTALSRGARDARQGPTPNVEPSAKKDSPPIWSAATRVGERTLLSVATSSTSSYSYEYSSSESDARGHPVGGTQGGGNTSIGLDSADTTTYSTQDSRSGYYGSGNRSASVHGAVTHSSSNDTYGTDRGNAGQGTLPHSGNEMSVPTSTRLLSSLGGQSTVASMGPPHTDNETKEVPPPTESTGKHGWTTAPPVFAVNEPSSQQPFTAATKQAQESGRIQSTAASAVTQRTQFTSRTTDSVPVTTALHPPSTTVSPGRLTPSATSRTTTGLPGTTGASEQLVPSGRDSPKASVTLAEAEGSTATPRHTHITGMTPIRTSTAEMAGNATNRLTPVPQATEQMHVPSTAAPNHMCDAFHCANGGTCVGGGDGRPRCMCLPSWTGPDCTMDVDECLSKPCPEDSMCENTRGSFTCECPLGKNLENGRSCTQVKTFLGTFRASGGQLNSTFYSSVSLHEVQRELLQLLNASLSSIKGYIRSTLSKSSITGGEGHISVVNMFSMSANITNKSVYENIQMFLNSCSPAAPHCDLTLQHQLFYRAESLCKAEQPQCDPDRSQCTDAYGTAFCQCRSGYFKHSTDDLSCRECDDGFKLENGTCVQCTFGFGGLNCGNFYKLITVVVSAAGGTLLLIMVVALIITCCRKGKNDINKIIFKSGDFQMSPYVEYRKSNRVSVEWGKETIELQENGSTKNLLQMTDIYYSAPLRNAEMERHGLYPFSGLPGSRHSCIYPAQWNPSFISDDTRRRDYF